MFQIEDLLRDSPPTLDLQSSQCADELRHLMDDAWFLAEPKVAAVVGSVVSAQLDKVRTELSRENSPLLMRYELYLKVLQAMRLSQLTLDELVELMRSSLVAILHEIPIDFYERFQVRFVLRNPLYPPSVWLEERGPVLQALLDNREVIGSGGLVKSALFVPTVGGWLHDYDHFSGGREVRTVVDREHYLTQGVASRQLGESDRSMLRSVLMLYDMFRLPLKYVQSSVTPGEKFSTNASDASVVLRQVVTPVGEITMAPVRVVPPIRLDEARLATLENELADELRNMSGVQMIHRIGEQATLAFRHDDVESILASVLYLARANAIGIFLRDEKNTVVRQEFVEVLKKKYGEAYVLAFEAHPDRLQFQTAFLDWIFREKLHLSEEDADTQRKVIVTLLAS